MPTSRPARVRVPELRGSGGWINTGGEQLSLEGLRGRAVLLDFWTFCCINCLHVVDELRPLEARFADVLVVIGVHSPKFPHEAGHEAVVAAVERYGVHHPVLDDPGMETWSQYAARAWPTLVLIDPEGYEVRRYAGEGHGEGLARDLEELVAEHEAKGTLRRGNAPYVPPPLPATELRFPGKVLPLAGGLLVSDSGHHRLVLLDRDDPDRVLRAYGDGERGLVDGPAPRFAEPQGLCALPASVAERVGYDVVVADTVNHVLRGLDTATGAGTTVAGTGRQSYAAQPGVTAARDVDLSSPWDVVWWPALERVVVAMAGVHQLWAFDPVASTAEPVAGTRGENLVDGPAIDALLAQPSGLALDTADPDRVWFADSENSALRWLQREVRGGSSRLAVHTAVGTGLFSSGHRDGPADAALLQHPLGVTALPDGSVVLSDTYNGALRRYDPTTAQVTTLATGLGEPSDAALVDGDLVVVESTAHRLTRPLPAGAARTVEVAARAHAVRRPVTELGPHVLLRVPYAPPPGQHLDEREGPATRLRVSAVPAELLLDGGGAATALERPLRLRPGAEGVLSVTATALSCDEAVEHPACRITTQDWGVPVRVVEGGPDRLVLALRGLEV